MLKNAVSLLTCAILLSSCSVAMAAKKSGHSIDEVQAANTRAQMLGLSQSVLSSEKNSAGQLVEIYRIEKPRGSTARAVMHGILDLSTFGIWEAVGTPIEGSINKEESFTIKVTYSAVGEKVEKVELN